MHVIRRNWQKRQYCLSGLRGFRRITLHSDTGWIRYASSEFESKVNVKKMAAQTRCGREAVRWPRQCHWPVFDDKGGAISPNPVWHHCTGGRRCARRHKDGHQRVYGTDRRKPPRCAAPRANSLTSGRTRQKLLSAFPGRICAARRRNSRGSALVSQPSCTLR